MFVLVGQGRSTRFAQIINVAPSAAKLADTADMDPPHIAEAIHDRTLDPGAWTKVIEMR